MTYNPWEAKNKSIPINFDPSKLSDYKKEALDPVEAMMDFAKTIENFGLVLTGLPEATGSIVRVPTKDDKRGQKTGWYILYDGEILAGSYGDFRSMDAGLTWSSIDKGSMSSKQLVDFQNRVREAKHKRELEIVKLQKEAAILAQAIWKDGKNAFGYPYLVNKELNVEAKLSQSQDHFFDWMMVPLFDQSGDIVSLQFISNEGKKYFLPNGRIQGCYYLTEGETDTIYIAEGYATALTVSEATDKACAVAWNANNLMAVCENVRSKYPNSVLIIAGDNDHETMIQGKLVNVGYEKANIVAKALGLTVIFPECKKGESDFNDIHVNYGIEKVRELLNKKSVGYDNAKDKLYTALPPHLLNPPAVLSDIVNYYNATCRAPQQGFAVQVALTIGSLICGRNFKTNKGNYSSLYFLNIAKSSTGKEHVKTVIENILEAVDKGHLVNGGYTSYGAVFSMLLKNPRHITIIDEFGLYLKAGKDQKNVNQQEAQTQLMEIFGRCHGILRPKTYSSMTKSDDNQPSDKSVKNPAVTLTAITTPEVFYQSINGGNISDGFMGRFIIHQSNQERAVYDEPDDIGIPSRIIDWIKAIDKRIGDLNEMSSERPEFIELSFDTQSLVLIKKFWQYQIDLQNELEKHNLEALAGRIKELAMRMSIIIALAKNPNAEVIDAESTEWAIEYIKFSITQTVKTMKSNVSDSEYEGQKQEILKSIRERGKDGIIFSDAIKQKPFSKYSRPQLNSIFQDLQEAELIDVEGVITKGRGRPSQRWYAITV